VARFWLLALVLATAGCRQLLGLEDLPDGSIDDAGHDASDAHGECAAWVPASNHFVPCAVPPSEPLVLTAGVWTYDTDSSELRDPTSAVSVPFNYILPQPGGGPEVRILSIDRLTITAGAGLRVTGSHPLLIASWDETKIDGTINAASVRSGAVVELGPGANDPGCQVAIDGHGTSDAGGGGGGGFGAPGGAGGAGKNNQNTGGSGGGVLASPQFVVGGCAGGKGGVGSDGGARGAGGGAIEIASPIAIYVAGAIHAGGSGGGGASNSAGGGGGGAGGYVGLDAPVVNSTEASILAANGGGGGTGCSNGNGAPGDNGVVGDQPAAGGGTGCPGNVNGGAGGARAQPTGNPGLDSGNGGGGGGGGAGVVVVWAKMVGLHGVSSPSVTTR